MKSFKEIYKNVSPVFSVEVFPPKTEKGVVNLYGELEKFKKYMNPSFVSVTYGAMGSTRNLTKDLALHIFKELGLITAFHFTCVGTDREQIKAYVEELSNKGIDHIVALRGDPPKGETEFTPPENGFRYANELVSYLNEIGNFSLAVAGYPEKHIEAVNCEDDLKNLKRKVDAGADIILTQLFYDNEAYFSFVEKARELGITIPIIPGILPVQSLKQVEKITGMCGAKLPENLYLSLKECGDDVDKMKAVGIEYATVQCKELLAKGAPGIHFYCLNKADAVVKIYQAIQK